jgi:hypothetical protein
MRLVEGDVSDGEKVRRHHGVTFLTLTLGGDTSDLSQTVDRLYAGFKALRKLPVFAANVTGGAAFLEITYNAEKRRWHPHLHIICRARFIPQADLSDAWAKVTNGSFRVDLRRVSSRRGIARYVCKYASKPMDGSFLKTPALLDEAVVALRGRRLCLTFGDWYGHALNARIEDPIASEKLSASHWASMGTLAYVRERAAAGVPEFCAALDALRRGRGPATTTGVSLGPGLFGEQGP